MDPQIYKWQKAILLNPNSEEATSIAKAFSDCSDLWGSVTRILSRQEWVQKGTLRKLESAHSYICLWADGYDVLSGQFEERLKNSQRAGDLTIRLLQNICQTLTQELTPVVAGLSTVPSQDATSLSLTAADLALTSERLTVLVQGDNDSDTSEDGEAGTSPESVPREKLLDGIADDLRSDTQGLLDLGPRFEEQVTNPIAREAAAIPLSLFNGRLSDTFTERIIRSYPQCESNLARRLGKANCLRVLKIAKCELRTSGGRVIEDQDDDTTHNAAENEPVGFGSVIDILSTWEQSLFHDSGVGTASHASVSHPVMEESGPETHNYPPLPDGAVQGEPFRCTACRGRVTITSDVEWRLHLLRDIEPYVCPELECDVPLFSSSRRLWTHVNGNHPASIIWGDSRCCICGAAVGDRATIMRHLADHMETIALAIVPQGPRIKGNKAPVTNARKTNETTTPRLKPEDKTLRTTRPDVRAGCLTCRKRRKKCDEKKPECENCTSGGFVCYGYSSSPRPRDAGSDSKPVELSPGLDQRHDTKTQNNPSRNLEEEWLSLFPDSRAPRFPLDDNFFERTGAHDRFWGPSLGSALFKLFEPSPPATEGLVEFGPHPPDSQPAMAPKPINTASSMFSRRGDKPLPPIIVDDPTGTVHVKRARNTLAVRKSRERKAQRLEELEEKIAKLEQERQKWKNVAVKRGAELP
ncbi:hypothetical protein ANO14919_140490 [Xylariales sp. No.14919]|nr:hypothetical protein ANO14919_140490 [Xylariales sp. No.14919]